MARGFTLMEIMLVIALLAIIMGVVMVKFTGVLEGQKPGLVRFAIDSKIPAALLMHYNKEGSFPKSLSELSPKLDNDPWGNAYQYKLKGPHNPGSYDLWSMGADGVTGGEGENKDIGKAVTTDPC